VPVLQQEGKGRNDTAWFWQYSKPGGLVYFDYQDSRSRAGPSHFLSDFKGRLQTDGYEVYTALVLNTAEDKIHTLLPENLRSPELGFHPPTPISAGCDHAHSPNLPSSPLSCVFMPATLRA
jgi:hypothetical protein